MSDTTVLRLAGASGILFLILFIPSYLTPPDAPIAASTPQQVFDYFNGRQGEIFLLNGVFLIFAAFCFILFMGVLHHAAQNAERGGLGFSSIILGGGLMFISLMLVGAAAEIVHSATQARFQNFRVDAQLGFLARDVGLALPLCLRRHVRVHRRDFTGEFADRPAACMAGLGGFRSGGGGAAPLFRPAWRLALHGVDRGGLGADAHRQLRPLRAGERYIVASIASACFVPHDEAASAERPPPVRARERQRGRRIAGDAPDAARRQASRSC